MEMENNVGIGVNVGVRVRPLFSVEDNNILKYIHGEGEPPVLMVADKRYVYAFDHVFSSNVHQCEVYNVMVRPMVSNVLNGYNCTIMAYGQTGTGKTYTMGTNSEKYSSDCGLIPRVLDQFFDVQDSEMKISVSFIEIYNEKVYDLLSPSKTALIVKGFCVNGMTCVPVSGNEDAHRWLLMGGKSRHVRHTTLNASSSRSHAIFTVYCTRTDTDITSKLHLVDLAGSESVRRTGNRGEAFQEGVTINRGLLAVGRVISALSDKQSVIPYRDSTLTTILHDSLSTNNYVSLLACISPSETDISETLATLRFAVQAKSVKSRPQLENIVSEYDRANPGVLGNVEPLKTTVKKKRKLPAMFTSTQIKRPLFGNRNVSIQSVDSRSTRFTSSPNYASTMDSLSISTSTTIDSSKQHFNLSPLVQRCTEALQNTVINHVNNIIQDKIASTPALFSKNADKENTSPPLILHWPTVESRMTEIIRKEFAELTANSSNLHKTKKNSSPLIKRHLDFDSPLATDLRKSSESVATKPEDNIFKVPVAVHRAVKRIKESEQQIISTTTSPIAVRRSLRLSLAAPGTSVAPTPAPRFKITKTENKITNSVSNFSSPFKPTRRSVRLSMKYIPIIPTPKPMIVEENSRMDSAIIAEIKRRRIVATAAAITILIKNEQNKKKRRSRWWVHPINQLRSQQGDFNNLIQEMSFESDFMPIPTPRTSVRPPVKKSKTSIQKENLKWKTPKKIISSPHKTHRFRTLRLLNIGSQKEIQSLATVGVKTALQIITYRSLNGEFKSLEYLKNIPTWGQKKYDRFMLANQLM